VIPEVIEGFLAVALLMAASCMPPEDRREPDIAAARSSVTAARELDQKGVRSYRAGRYTDAIAYFRAAHTLGGPSSELWNIVRCRERMDDLEGASAAVDEYLALKDVLPQDRAEAQREAQTLRTRPSVLTVTTSPVGAAVTVDGKPTPGLTPVSVEIRPGSHALFVRRDGYSPVTQSLEAHFGRAVIVTLDLERAAR
jgi:hypothetical protein